mmetsp:Transcript_91262/g.181979  ORF Transcript_91262/g.181979 Transcript_91262/m.181979 type:complete len:81 (+) Transcript_91262:287-529(+)
MTAAAAAAAAAASSSRFLLSGGSGGGSGGGRVPNVPLLDVCTGKWRGLWDLFRGCVVVLEFYLSSLNEARSVAPVIAVDP